MIQIIADRLRFVAQTIVKRVKQITRPANGSRTSNLVIDIARSKHDLLIENALLRLQLIVLKRRQKRPQLSNWDRIKLICPARLTPNWKDALHIVQPDTLLSRIDSRSYAQGDYHRLFYGQIVGTFAEE